MNSDYELALQGEIDSDQLLKLDEIFNDDTTISLMEVKSGGIEETIRLIFHDFNIVTFTRDFILGATLTGVITKLKKTIYLIKGCDKVISNS